MQPTRRDRQRHAIASSWHARCSTSASATRTSQRDTSASSAACAARSTTTGTTKSRSTTASSRKTRRPFGFLDRQRFMLAMDAGRQSGHRADPVPLAIRSDLRRSPTIRRRPGRRRPPAPMPAKRPGSRPISPPACPTIRSAAADNSAAVDYFDYNARTNGFARAVRAERLRRRRYQRIVRAAGRPGPLRARRRISAGEGVTYEQDDPFVDETAPTPTPSSSAASIRTPSR